MLRAAGRNYHRKVREFREQVPEQANRDLDYDCISRMQAIDSMDRHWRNLINEHGFVPVIKCLRETRDFKEIKKMLAQRHERRQAEIAEGRC